jgi:putative DNA modification/repair radical SAM protein
MELLLQTVKKLRQEYGFKGYIHMKAIPGANPALIAQAGLYVDRMSVNIELPSEASLRLLAPQKNREKIILPMREIASGIIANQQERKHFAKAPIFVPAGQTTQLIIGASPENDLHIIQLAEDLYHKFKLRRVYYSAFIPVSSDPRLPRLSHPPLLREHRLYQADWLLRLYHFSSTEILDTYHPYLDEDLDPKSSWALRNLQFFPVEVNEADYETLLRVPGIGIKSARKILIARKFHSLDFSDLKKMGVVWKRARYFITCNGRYFANATLDPEGIRERIKLAFHPVTREEREGRQLTLLAGSSSLLNTQDAYSSVTGEL